MSSFSKRLGGVVAGVAVIAGSFFVGNYYGTSHAQVFPDSTASVVNKDMGKPGNVDFAPFWEAWNILSEKYVATHKGATGAITDQDKVWGAIKGLTESLGDPYTTFFPPQEAKEFQSQIAGNFEGVGMEVGMKDGIVTVIAPLKNSPSEKAGLKAGDHILQINATSTANISIDEAVRLMRGPKGSTVKLLILSPNDTRPREISIVREVINIPTIDTKARKDGIFVISLYSFSENSATLFRNALQEFVKSGDSKLVLDLRGNPGGYLDAAVDMASWFLPADKVIVKEDSGGHGDDFVYNSKGYNAFANKKIQMMILVDGGSASASEILAGALQEHGIAKLVGTKTFGKGSVQQLVNLTPETSLKITVARWLTPNGKSISEQGLAPDVEVKITEDDITKQNDAQFKKAIELLGGNATLK